LEHYLLVGSREKLSSIPLHADSVVKFNSPKLITLLNKSFKHRTFGTGQFLSRSFMILLRKIISQNRNLKTAA